MDGSRNMTRHKYERDYLLQLRLHPFSLQKPDNLKVHDIVKEKLYLHQLNFGTGSQNSCLSYSDFQVPSKNPENVLRYHHPIPDCYSQNCSFITGHKCNRLHGKASSKSRQLYIPEYINSMQKLQFQNSNDCEEFLHNDVYCSGAPWIKHCCSFSEETWSCQNQQSDLEFCKSSYEGSGKSKKNPLPIIDPKNGKNILDNICKNSTSPESISESIDGDSGTIRGYTSILETNKHPDKDECTLPERNDGTENISINLSNTDSCNHSQTANSGYQNLSDKNEATCVDNRNNTVESFENESSAFDPGLDVNLKKVNEKKVGVSMKEMLDADSEKYTSSNYYESKTSDPFESLEGNSKDIHGDCTYQRKKSTDRNKTILIQENNLNLEDEMKMNVKLLREKIYSLRQEQQKMAVLQSFLHFKKHQLDESYRRMDNKKIEIANFECSLMNKAKRLQEKECRLEAKRLNLLDKESKLDEREKALNENRKYVETKIQQNDKTAEIIDRIGLEIKLNDPKKTFSISEFGDTQEVKN